MPVARPFTPAESASRPADSYVVGPLDVTTAADWRANLIDVLDNLDALAVERGADRNADRTPDRNADADSDVELVVDLSGVGAVDMVGVGLLVGVHRQAGRRGRRLVLTGVPPRVMRLLTATRLRRVLAVRDQQRVVAI